MASNWQVQAPSQNLPPVTPEAAEQTNRRIAINVIRAPAATEFPLSHRIRTFPFLRNRASQSRSNHLLAATGPADVLLRFVNRDGQIVATLVSSRRGARRASRDPVPPRLPPYLEMIQDVKLPLLCRVLPAWSWLDFLLLPFARLPQLLEQNPELLLGQIRHALEECQLIVEIVIGTVEPEPSADRAMNSQRSTDRIAEVAILQLVMLREYLDSLGRPRSFYRDTEFLSQAGDQEPALSGQKRLLAKYPKVGAAPTLFQRRLHLLLLQFPLQFTKVLQRVLIIPVHCNPLASLRRRTHRIHADRQITFQMSPDRLSRQTGRLAVFPGLRPEIVIATAFRVRPHRLENVGAPIHEQLPIVLHICGSCLIALGHSGFSFRPALS